MSLYLGTSPIAVNSSSRNIGEIIQSTIPLTDAGLHLLDGSLISGSGSYSAFVVYIAGLVSSYPDLFETEANWQQSVTTYGVCGKFVYDSVNNTVRLPKITGFTEGTIDTTTLGNLTEAGLPNITGKTGAIYSSNDYITGALTNTTHIGGNYGITPSTSGGTKGRYVELDASNSNSIYGNSTTVQPQAIKVLYYIVIATSTKTNIEVDIDEIATDLNGKADVDLSNVNASGTALASGWSMPSSRYDDLTLGASGATYTAPANGYVCISKLATASGQYIQIYSDNDLMAVIGRATGNVNVQQFMPVKKGDTFSVAYNVAGAADFFRFVYAEGEN